MLAIIENDIALADRKPEDRLRVIYFDAPWCGPCKAFGPVFKEVADGRDDVEFLKAGVDSCPDAATAFSVRSVPALLGMRGGEIINTKTGPLSRKALGDWIDDMLARYRE